MNRYIVVGSLLAVSTLPGWGYLVSGSNGPLSASADFTSLSGGTQLQVTLTNTSLNDVLVQSQVLTGVFFNLSGGLTLTPVSALLAGGSTVFFDPDGQPTGGNVGGEWAYGAGLASPAGFGTRGISSAGFGLFGGSNFNGPNLDGPAAVAGTSYGLLSAGDNTATGQNPVTGNFPYIKNAVVFTLSVSGGALPTLNGTSITNVVFQYGSSLGEATATGGPPIGGEPCIGTVCADVPEPGFYGLLASGLSGLLLVSQLMRSRSAKGEGRGVAG